MKKDRSDRAVLVELMQDYLAGELNSEEFSTRFVTLAAEQGGINRVEDPERPAIEEMLMSAAVYTPNEDERREFPTAYYVDEARLRQEARKTLALLGESRGE